MPKPLVKKKKAGRTKLEQSSNTTLMGIKIPENLIKEFEKISLKMGLTKSQLARIVISSFVDEYKNR